MKIRIEPYHVQSLLKLVGGLHACEQDDAWFASTYNRLINEVSHAGEVTRIVTFDVPGRVRFAGIEVERIAEIPAGMVAWELRDDTWIMRDATGAIAWHAPLTWQWRSISEVGRWVGEFSARCPEEWDGGIGEFQMTANSYLKPGEACDDEIVLADPDPSWARQYEAFAEWLRSALGPEVVRRIEHYGSTAIPGLPAKPVIDVPVEVPSFTIARMTMLPLLNREEWEYWWYRDHKVFIKRQALMGRRTHHLHVASAGDRLWEGIAFRDYLRAHPEAAARYAELKRGLAARFREDREGYTAAKAAFVREITAKAMQRIVDREEA